MADWPTADELKRVLDVTSEGFDETIYRVQSAAIAKVKFDVGQWDEDVDQPDDALAQAALRMAELISERPGVAQGSVRDPAYLHLMSGHRRAFGIA